MMDKEVAGHLLRMHKDRVKVLQKEIANRRAEIKRKKKRIREITELIKSDLA